SEVRPHIAWLTFVLGFVGGYADSASFVLANTFTGHVTGAFVLAAISAASHDWSTYWVRITGIPVFLGGILLSATLRRLAAGRSAWLLFSSVMGIEAVLISGAYLALTSHLPVRIGLFVICMSLALGLQDGTCQRQGGISVHSTYLT